MVFIFNTFIVINFPKSQLVYLTKRCDTSHLITVNYLTNQSMLLFLMGSFLLT